MKQIPLWGPAKCFWFLVTPLLLDIFTQGINNYNAINNWNFCTTVLQHEQIKSSNLIPVHQCMKLTSTEANDLRNHCSQQQYFFEMPKANLSTSVKSDVTVSVSKCSIRCPKQTTNGTNIHSPLSQCRNLR